MEGARAPIDPAPRPEGASSGDAPLSVLGLSARPANALVRLGVKSVGQLRRLSRKELLKARGLGAGSLKEIQEALARRGLELGGGATEARSAAAGHSRLLQRDLSASEQEVLQAADLTSLPGRPGGRVRTLLERTGARTLLEVARLDPGELRRLPNVGTKTVDALRTLMDQWLKEHGRPEERPAESRQDLSPLLGRRLTAEECAAAAAVQLPPDAGRATLLDLLLAEPAAPTEGAAERASQRAEALLFAAHHHRDSPSEFFGYLLEAAHLTPREALVVRLRWGIGVKRAESLREVGARFNLSGEWARRLEVAMAERLTAHYAGDQVRQYARGLCRRLRWPASRWGLLTPDELQEGMSSLLGGAEGLQSLQTLLHNLAGLELGQVASEVWPRCPQGGWFARCEEILRLAQAMCRRGLDSGEEPPPGLEAWHARVREVCRASAPPEEDAPEPDLAAVAAALAARRARKAAAPPAPAPRPPAAQPPVRPAPAPDPAPAQARPEVSAAAPAAQRAPARDFVAGFLRQAGGQAPLEAIVAAGTEAGYPAQRIESVCRNLRRRFVLDAGVVRLA